MDIVCGNGSCGLVVTELSHIKQLVTQLQVQLGESPDLCKRLTAQIFSLTERSIGIITSPDFTSGGGRKRCAADAGLSSATPSPLSDVVDAPFNKTNNKKRKMVEKRAQQVRVTSGCGGEAVTPVDDGHSWRKYGQKEILGAKHPRGYYRCTYRPSQGCTATKQVQRTDNDPELFDVVYLGTHTCVHRTTAADPAAKPPKPNPNAHSLLQNLSANLTVKTEGLTAPGGATTPFCFSLTPASVCLAPEQSPFSAPSTSENWGVSPATSDSFTPFEWRAQSELQEVVSALVTASTPAVPAVEFDDEFLDIDSFFV